MPVYRHDRLPGGGHYIRRTSWEDEAAGAIVGGAAAATGWVIGASISGLRTLARNARDRRLALAASALEEASESDDDQHFLAIAEDFTRQYPHVPDGHALLAQALQRNGKFDAGISAADRAEQLGLDELHARMIRADIFDDAGKPGKALQEYTALSRVDFPEIRQVSLLQRARILTGIGDLEQALRDANEAISILPDESAYLVRGHIHRSGGDLNACLSDYTRAISLDSGNHEFYETRAEVYEQLGRLDEAVKDRAAAAAIAEAGPQDSIAGPTQQLAPPTAGPASALNEDSALASLMPWVIGAFGLIGIVFGISLVTSFSGGGGGIIAVFVLLLLLLAGGGGWYAIRSRQT